MILRLSVDEYGLLSYVLHRLRIPAKKGFKKRYPGIEAKKHLSCYDAILRQMGRIAGQVQDRNAETVDLQLNENELEMLHSFLIWYIAEVGKDGTGKETTAALELLESIRVKVEEMRIPVL